MLLLLGEHCSNWASMTHACTSALEDAEADPWETDQAEADGTGPFLPDPFQPAASGASCPGAFQEPPHVLDEPSLLNLQVIALLL